MKETKKEPRPKLTFKENVIWFFVCLWRYGRLQICLSIVAFGVLYFGFGRHMTPVPFPFQAFLYLCFDVLKFMNGIGDGFLRWLFSIVIWLPDIAFLIFTLYEIVAAPIDFGRRLYKENEAVITSSHKEWVYNENRRSFSEKTVVDSTSGSSHIIRNIFIWIISLVILVSFGLPLFVIFFITRKGYTPKPVKEPPETLDQKYK